MGGGELEPFERLQGGKQQEESKNIHIAQHRARVFTYQYAV